MTAEQRVALQNAISDALAWEAAFGPETDLSVEDDYDHMARVVLDLLEERGVIARPLLGQSGDNA